MKQFLAVLGFELRGYAKNKVFVGITVALVLVVAAVLSFPTLRDAMSGPSQPEATMVPGTEPGDLPDGGGPVFPQDAPAVALWDESGAADERLISMLEGMLGYRVEVVSGDEATVRAGVEDGTYEAAVLLEGPLEAEYIARNVSMYASPGAVLEEALRNAYQQSALAEKGFTPEEASGFFYPQVKVSVSVLEKNQIENFFYTYVLSFALYMGIMLYGQLVATAVATEKSTRTMELLITSAKPSALMFGKVIGSGLAGLAQFALILGSGAVFFRINEAAWAGNMFIASIFDMPMAILGYALLFFVLGYFIYAFLYGAMGSLASRTEDINTSVLPITFTFIAAFMVVMMSMASGNVDSGLMRICSFVPLTSPMAMFVRISMGEVAVWEIIVSVLLLLASTAAIGWISARIYRVGVLMYGKPPKLGELFAILRADRKSKQA